MPSTHQFANQFIEMLSTTQAAYAARDAEGYVAAFSENYYSVQLDQEFEENREQLRRKIEKDIDRFDILQMDFEVKRSWFAGNTGFAHLAYLTRMRFKGTERCISDKRENLIVGNHTGGGRWEIICKTILRAQTVVEQEQAPEI